MRYYGIFLLLAVSGACVALASDNSPPPEKKDSPGITREERFAARGQADLLVASTAALDLKAEDERRWGPALEMGRKAVELAEMKGDRKPAGPIVFKDLPAYRQSYSPEFIHTNNEYTRLKEDAAGQLICARQVAVQAAKVKAEWTLNGLILSRGPVVVEKSIRDSLIMATGDIRAAGCVCSVIICDGDVVIDGATRALIIARGKIEVKKADSSTLIACGEADVGEMPKINIPPMPLDDRAAMARWKAAMEVAEIQMVIVKHKEPHPLGFITFFELSTVGLEVKSADKVVEVAKLVAGKPCEKAKMKVGDTILEVEGKKPTDAESLRRLLRDSLAIGDATVKIQRGKETLDVKVSLPE